MTDQKESIVIYSNSTLNNIYTGIKEIYKNQDSTPLIVLAMFMFLIAILFLFFAIRIIKSARQYKSVSKSEYKPLIEMNNENNDDHDDYELNNNDIKGFVGKIKPTKASRLANAYTSRRVDKSASIEETSLMITDN